MKKVSNHFSRQDIYFMKMALNLSRRGLGATHPNPSVGCVIVKDNHVIGRGWTGPSGRPHAEINALESTVASADNSTVYVTLEPCSHQGKTAPCASALVNAKVSKVIIATIDPDPRVSGKGIKIIEDADIDVEVGLLKDEADFINQGFFQKIILNRPLLTVKFASSIDGKIAHKKSEKSWITGTESRKRGHLYRANHDAIMVGIGTVLVDNPMLDCRINGLEDRSPIRVVVDTELRCDINTKLCVSAGKIPLWIMTSSNDVKKIATFENVGVKIFILDKDKSGYVNIDQVMKTLAQQGITRVLSEGGGKLNASLIKAGLIDRLLWFKSKETIGEKGVNALYDIDVNELDQHLNFILIDEGLSGSDSWQEYKIVS